MSFIEDLEASFTEERWREAWIEADNLFSSDVEASFRLAHELVEFWRRHQELRGLRPALWPHRMLPQRMAAYIVTSHGSAIARRLRLESAPPSPEKDRELARIQAALAAPNDTRSTFKWDRCPDESGTVTADELRRLTSDLTKRTP